jgi:hypothetical protein
VEEQRKKCFSKRMSMRKLYINSRDFHRSNTIKPEPPFVKGIVVLETKGIRRPKSAVTVRKNLSSAATNAVVSALGWKRPWMTVVRKNVVSGLNSLRPSRQEVLTIIEGNTKRVFVFFFHFQ